MKIISIVGARPNFIKIAPLAKEFKAQRNVDHVIVHTGQHYDYEMSKQFFEDLDIPEPEINLEVGSGSHGEQTARILEKLEQVFVQEKPNLVLVVGDVNSTLAGSLAAAKMNIKVAHVEAGLRSYDRTMPEEVNRIVTDHLSDFLFTSFRSAGKTLRSEGITKEKIFFVGNVMIDSLVMNMQRIDQADVVDSFKLVPKDYCVVTMHRPSNVDNKRSLQSLLEIFQKIQAEKQIVFSLHPRTESRLKEFGLMSDLAAMKNVKVSKPLGYIKFLALVKNSSFVLTDSGGIQEETTFLRVPCITMRTTTERPETVTCGTNILAGNDKDAVLRAFEAINRGNLKKGRIPQNWDGNAAKRIAKVLLHEPPK